MASKKKVQHEFIIRTINLSKKYNRLWAVRNMDLRVERGQIFGFLGPNGAGKSTTIRMLMSLISVTKGTIEIYGMNPNYKSAAIYSRVGALVDGSDFYHYLSGYQNLRILGDLNGHITKSRIEEVLEMVSLTEKQHEKVKKYSHGMRQRLGIAQAFLHRPELVILDEPMTNLSPEGIRDVREMIRYYREEYGTTFFISSHRLYEIQQICTHMAVVDEGQIIVQGSVEDILQNTEYFITEIETNDLEKSKKILDESELAEEIVISHQKLKIHTTPENRPAIVKLLVENNIDVSTVMPRTNLEDYYLSIIKEKHKA
ncbi:MAG: ABC transporter ATP-binding protein [Candidatus Marinimicrobia bacterium]|nr:ABC transporter ATP-binding protein [Candidatus Neomarinimicrobiota bacterium]